MNKMNVSVGLFVTAAVALFAAGLFLIGDQHKAFRHHVIYYTSFANLSGITKGAKVRVAGLDAGQVKDIDIPQRPAEKFRLKLEIEDRVRGLVRTDSVVSIESEGLVGDKFVLIKQGTDTAALAPSESNLTGKETVELGQMLEKASGLLNQVGDTLTDVRGKLDGTLTSITTTVNNTNGLVTDVRSGKGAAGLLLEDKATADQVRQVVTNGRDVTANLNRASIQVNDLLTDFKSRDLPQKTDDTLNNVRSASQQLNQTSQKLNQTLDTAFGDDQFGENAGSNLRQSLANVNQATGNLADDTEALKHGFFFRGFFKHRGYYNLDQLPVEEYRNGTLFKKPPQHREWLQAASLFEAGTDGKETLSETGRQQIDQAVGQITHFEDTPIIVEGYASQGHPEDTFLQSRSRALLVRQYLQLHFHLQPKNIGVIALRATPPSAAGKTSWDGICITQLAPAK